MISILYFILIFHFIFNFFKKSMGNVHQLLVKYEAAD